MENAGRVDKAMALLRRFHTVGTVTWAIGLIVEEVGVILGRDGAETRRAIEIEVVLGAEVG